MDNGEKVVLGIVIGGLTAAAGAVAYALYRREEGDLGRTEVVEKGGMKLTYTRRPRMSIKKRVGKIQDLVFKSVLDPTINKLGLQITASCPERDGMCEARAVYDYVKANVRYSGDIAPIKHGARGRVEAIDRFASAKRTLEFGAEDCDGHATTVAALLAVNGIAPVLRVTSHERFGGDDSYGHIYAGALLPKEKPAKFVAVDTTLPGDGWFGKEVPFARKRDFPA